MATDKDVMAAVAAALEKAAASVHPEDFDEGSSEWCALMATHDIILALITTEQASALEERLNAARLEEARNVHVVMRGETCGAHCMGCVRIAALERKAAQGEAVK